MKKLIMTILGCMALAACTKSSSTTPTSTTSTTTTTTTTTSNSAPNKVTITDNGTTYVDSGASTVNPSAPYVTLVVHKYTDNCVLQISTSTTSLPFYIDIATYGGPVSGIGTYVVYRNTAAETYTENFNGGQTYHIDTAVLTTTTCSSANVSGSFTLWLSNTTGSKTVTGTFNCNKPGIL